MGPRTNLGVVCTHPGQSPEVWLPATTWRGRESAEHQCKLPPTHFISQVSRSPQLLWHLSKGKNLESWSTCHTPTAAPPESCLLLEVSYSAFQTWRNTWQARTLCLGLFTRSPWPPERWFLVQEWGTEKLQALSGLWYFLPVLRQAWLRSRHKKGIRKGNAVLRRQRAEMGIENNSFVGFFGHMESPLALFPLKTLQKLYSARPFTYLGLTWD